MSPHLENLEALLKRAEELPLEQLQQATKKHYSNGSQEIKFPTIEMDGKLYFMRITTSQNKGEVTVYQGETTVVIYTITEQQKRFLGIPYTLYTLSVKETDTPENIPSARLNSSAYHSLYYRMNRIIKTALPQPAQRTLPSFGVKGIIQALIKAPWKVEE